MIILGLTGSIGMGKSTTAKMFGDAGVPVYDADAAVHEVYESPSMIGLIEEAFPGTTNESGVDRKKLGQAVLGNKDKIQKLEGIVHPAVHVLERGFLQKHQSSNTNLVVLDIPLLFETDATSRVDKILVVTAPPEVQRQRVLARDGMTEERLEKILARQMPDEEKRRRADFVIDTSLGMDNARNAVRDIIAKLTKA